MLVGCTAALGGSGCCWVLPSSAAQGSGSLIPTRSGCTHHVEVLLVVATQQEEEVGTRLVQQRLPAELGEKPPQLPHPQRGIRSAEQELQEQRARLVSGASVP